jgi:hypothetical protein
VYLRKRGIELLPGDDALRFHPSCPFGSASSPCLIGLFRDIRTNAPKAIHRTALKAGGFKVDRKAMGPISGCAIKLTPDEDVEHGLTIGEGIETTLAGMQLGFKPAWAAGSSDGIKAFPVLPGIEALTILVDADLPDKNDKRPGPEAAVECSRRWTAAGCEVRRVIPRPGRDMADLISEVSRG